MISKREELQMNRWKDKDGIRMDKKLENMGFDPETGLLNLDVEKCTVDDRVTFNSPTGVTIHCPVHRKGHFIRGNTRINHTYRRCIMNTLID